jgi:hypothetical protein
MVAEAEVASEILQDGHKKWQYILVKIIAIGCTGKERV